MALIFEGETVCPICGQILRNTDDIFGLPFISDTLQNLYPYFDHAFHSKCFNEWDHKDEIFKILEQEKHDFQRTSYFRVMLEKLGPPKFLEETFVEVIHSFKISDDRILVFLKWNKGKLPHGAFLDNLAGKIWTIKQYVWMTGSIENYEKTKKEESENIFQYELNGVSTTDKPEKDSFLKISNCA